MATRKMEGTRRVYTLEDLRFRLARAIILQMPTENALRWGALTCLPDEEEDELWASIYPTCDLIRAEMARNPGFDRYVRRWFAEHDPKARAAREERWTYDAPKSAS